MFRAAAPLGVMTVEPWYHDNQSTTAVAGPFMDGRHWHQQRCQCASRLCSAGTKALIRGRVCEEIKEYINGCGEP